MTLGLMAFVFPPAVFVWGERWFQFALSLIFFAFAVFALSVGVNVFSIGATIFCVAHALAGAHDFHKAERQADINQILKAIQSVKSN
jgi:hypothetical protein